MSFQIKDNGKEKPDASSRKSEDDCLPFDAVYSIGETVEGSPQGNKNRRFQIEGVERNFRSKKNKAYGNQENATVPHEMAYYFIKKIVRFVQF